MNLFVFDECCLIVLFNWFNILSLLITPFVELLKCLASSFSFRFGIFGFGVFVYINCLRRACFQAGCFRVSVFSGLAFSDWVFSGLVFSVW